MLVLVSVLILHAYLNSTCFGYYFTGNSRCPVVAYKLFESKRPTDMMKPESPFYINRQCESSGVWYINQAMG